MLLCQTDVTGEGIIITLKDGTTNSSDILSSSLMATDVIVHNSDLYHVVNDLKNAGAEAIEINGQRVVNTSSITYESFISFILTNIIGKSPEIPNFQSSDCLYFIFLFAFIHILFIGLSNIIYDIIF